jgi:hypothetical protein
MVGPGLNLPIELTIELMMKYYNYRCKPPWSREEIEHKVGDAYRKEARRGWWINQNSSL